MFMRFTEKNKNNRKVIIFLCENVYYILFKAFYLDKLFN